MSYLFLFNKNCLALQIALYCVFRSVCYLILKYREVFQDIANILQSHSFMLSIHYFYNLGILQPVMQFARIALNGILILKRDLRCLPRNVRLAKSWKLYFKFILILLVMCFNTNFQGCQKALYNQTIFFLSDYMKLLFDFESTIKLSKNYTLRNCQFSRCYPSILRISSKISIYFNDFWLLSSFKLSLHQIKVHKYAQTTK